MMERRRETMAVRAFHGRALLFAASVSVMAFPVPIQARYEDFTLQIGFSGVAARVPVHSVSVNGQPVTPGTRLPGGPKNAGKGNEVAIETLELAVGWGATSRPFLDYFEDFFRGSAGRTSGTILVYHAQGTGRLEFKNARITEVRFPACDASAKEPAYLSLKMAPEYTRYQKGGMNPARRRAAQKLWLPSNFRLTIDGLDCSAINKIDAFTVKQTRTRAPERGHTKVWGDPHVLKVTMPERTLRTWSVKWVGPELDASKNEFTPRAGKIEYLSAQGQPLATLSFRVSRLGRLRSIEGGSAAAELYCDSFKLK
jgi:hypothetical protein